MGKIVGKAPIYETIPPHQEKFPRGGPGGTNDWDLNGTALPTGSPHISTQPGNDGVLARECEHANNPMYDSDNSRFAHQSMTDGKGRR